MRIAYLSTTYPPMVSGVSLTLERLAIGMHARGHSVLVIAASDQPRPYITEKEGFRLARLRSYPNPVGAGYRFMLWHKRAIRRELSAFRPDIIHLHDSFNVSLAGAETGRKFGIPVIYTVHQLPWVISSLLSPIAKLKEAVDSILLNYGNWLLKKCDAVIAPSKMIAETVEMLSNRRVHTISNGVDLSTFKPQPQIPQESLQLRKKYQLDPDLPIVLCVGRLSVEKQIPTIIKAFAKVLETTPAILAIVGDGPYKNALEKQVRELGISDRARFLGILRTNGDLPGMYRAASVFAMASEVEAQGLVLLEAAASGIPTVAVSATCVPEIVQESATGFLVKPGDTDLMASKIISMIENQKLAEEMGRTARKVAELHSNQSSLDAHEELYREFLDARG